MGVALVDEPVVDLVADDEEVAGHGDARDLPTRRFAERLLREERVAVVPGSAFGASGRGHVRLCYAASDDRLVEAVERIGRFVARARAGRHDSAEAAR